MGQSLQRRHFVAFAEAIADLHYNTERVMCANLVAGVCHEFNPRFARHRFMVACDADETEERKSV